MGCTDYGPSGDAFTETVKRHSVPVDDKLPGTEMPGVWVVYYHDAGIHVHTIHLTEIEALRDAVKHGMGFKVALIRLTGVDVITQIGAHEGRMADKT